MKVEKGRLKKTAKGKVVKKKAIKKAETVYAGKNKKIIRKKISEKKSDFSKKYSRRKNDLYLTSGKTRFMFKFGVEKIDANLPCRRKADLVRCEKLIDNDLVKVVLDQNPEAYRILFKRYEKSLYIYMFHMVRNKEEVEDLLQNVFTKTFKSLAGFDRERKFSSWIYRISHNEAVNFIKRRSKRKLVSWEDVTTSKDKLDTSVEAEDAAENFMHVEISKEIDEALKEIPEKYRHVLAMRYFEELSYEVIGKKIGKPVNTVGTLINRAKKKLLEVVNSKRKG